MKKTILSNKEVPMADNYINEEKAFSGNVKIADDVISSIAALAATDVEGVHAMAGNTTKELVAKFGGKSLGRGVKAVVDEDDVRLSLGIIVEYGCSIPEVCKNVQDKVRATIENMTGFTVSEINVTIAGINISENA